jgi:hypothetical protein
MWVILAAVVLAGWQNGQAASSADRQHMAVQSMDTTHEWYQRPRHVWHPRFQSGVYNQIDTSFASLKWYKVGGDTLQQALYHSVGTDRAYMEHTGLAAYASQGLCSLASLLPVLRERVVFVAMMRDPAERLMSAINMAVAGSWLHLFRSGICRKEDGPSQCRSRAPGSWNCSWPAPCHELTGSDVIETASRCHSRSTITVNQVEPRVDAPPYFLWPPDGYAKVLGLGKRFNTTDEVLRHLQDNFVVGVTERMPNLLELLNRALLMDAAARSTYTRPHFMMHPGRSDVHNSSGHSTVNCKPEHLKRQAQKYLRSEMAADYVLYDAAKRISASQLAAPPQQLPVHTLSALGAACAAVGMPLTTQ